MQFRETMRATQSPDVYGGPECNQHIPRWVGSAEGDKDGDSPIGPIIDLAAETFPPGTEVRVLEPCCPHCHEVPTLMNMPGQSGQWECGCGFDWKRYTDEQFS